MSFFVELIVALLKAFFPALKNATKDDFTVAVPEDEGLKKRLRDKVKGVWGTTAFSFWICCLCFALVGCGTRTLYIPDGQPVRLRESLKGVKIWVKDAEGNTVATFMDVPEGWFLLPDTPD